MACGIGTPRPADGVESIRGIQFVSPQFFETFTTPLIAGRTFDWNDVFQDRPVAVVSENLACAEWGSAGSAVGRR